MFRFTWIDQQPVRHAERGTDRQIDGHTDSSMSSWLRYCSIADQFCFCFGAACSQSMLRVRSHSASEDRSGSQGPPQTCRGRSSWRCCSILADFIGSLLTS